MALRARGRLRNCAPSVVVVVPVRVARGYGEHGSPKGGGRCYVEGGRACEGDKNIVHRLRTKVYGIIDVANPK